jgi:trimethylamine corrinoid protein
MTNTDDLKAELARRLLANDTEACIAWTEDVLRSGVGPLVFFNEVFTPAMAAIGDKFGCLEIFLPELMDAADRAKAISDQVLKPRLAEQGSGGGEPRGKVVICSVQGDLHDIGKNMVALMLQVNSFDVVDLGINVSPREALARAKEVGADILGLSSLMTTSMPYMKECVALRDGLGLKEAFAVVVGGAPITDKYCQEIGADEYGQDAIEAVHKCIALMETRRAPVRP